MPLLMRTLLVISLLFWPFLAFSQDAPPAADEQKESIKGFQFRFKERPSFRYGDNLRLDIKAKWHLDFRNFYPNVVAAPETGDVFNVTRSRFGIKGEVTKFFDYEVEREFRGSFSDDHPYHPWKDVYVDFKPLSFVRLK